MGARDQPRLGGICLREATGDACVIFIHGVLSHGELAWMNGNGTTWPDLLAREPDLSSVGIYSFSYETDLFSRTYNVGDIADAIFEFLDTEYFWNLKNIVFVCHSMGGIAVRRFIVDNQLRLLEKAPAIGLFLVASPSLGSKDANAIAIFARLLRNSQLEALRFAQNNLWLNQLDKDFWTILRSNKIRLVGKELIEDKPIQIKRWLGLWTQIVEPISSGRYFDRPFKIPRSDHISIAKPIDRLADQHTTLVRFISRFLRRAENPSPESYSIDVTPQRGEKELAKKSELSPPAEKTRFADFDIVEDVLELDKLNKRTRVPLPPFLSKPDITIWRDTGNARSDPEIESTTPDQFTVKMVSDDQAGKWRWRARGTLSRDAIEKPQKVEAGVPKDTGNSKIARSLALAVILVGLLAFGFYWLRATSPTISEVRLFDETKNKILPSSGDPPRHTLTELDSRSGNDFRVGAPEDFLFALGFVVDGIKVSPGGRVQVKLLIEGLSNDGGPIAWLDDGELSNKLDWQNFDIAKSVGSIEVAKKLHVTSDQEIPIALIIECRTADEMRRWSGEIQIKVRDQNGDGQFHQLPQPFSLKLYKPIEIAQTEKRCPK
jgi:hypothetical protein